MAYTVNHRLRFCVWLAESPLCTTSVFVLVVAVSFILAPPGDKNIQTRSEQHHTALCCQNGNLWKFRKVNDMTCFLVGNTFEVTKNLYKQINALHKYSLHSITV